MTIVNHDTGEITELDAAAAGRRADQITARLLGIKEVGMSTRAIASVVGVSNKTVSLDRGVTEVTPAPTPGVAASCPNRHTDEADQECSR